MAPGQGKLVIRVDIPVERIVAEAKRWGVADEVGLQVSPTGIVSVAVATARGHQFVEHLSSLAPSVAATSEDGDRGTSNANTEPLPFRDISTGEWPQIVRWANQIEADVAARRRVDAAVALRLARAVRGLGQE